MSSCVVQHTDVTKCIFTSTNLLTGILLFYSVTDGDLSGLVYAAVAINSTHLYPFIAAKLCNLLSFKHTVSPKMARPVA